MTLAGVHHFVGIGRLRSEASVIDVAAYGEMVERLKRIVAEAEDIVHGIIEEAADARGTKADGLSFQVKHLGYCTGLPVQAAVEPIAELPEWSRELRDEAQRERAVAGDFLAAADLRDECSHVQILHQK